MNTEFRCERCNKKLFEGNIALLLQKKHHDPDEAPHIDALCHRCKHLNRFVYTPAAYVAK